MARLSILVRMRSRDPGTGWFRAHPGIRNLMVPFAASLVDTVIRDLPPHGISLSTVSAMSFASTLNDVSLETYKLT